MDLRKALRTGVSRSPRDCGCFRTCCEGAAAALRVLSVILTTSVDRIAFSFAVNSSTSWLSAFWDTANVFLVGGLVVLPGFVWVVWVATLFRPPAPTGIASFWPVDAVFVAKRSLRVDTVARVVVDVELSALLTNSSFS